LFFSLTFVHFAKIKHFDNYDEEWLDFVVMNRNEDNPEPTHNYDIVEGPVADDKIQNRIGYYLSGQIDKKAFLEELKWHEETHQVCFCTVVSLQTLKQTDYLNQISLFTHIGEPIVEKLVTDFGLDEQTAGEKFFSSATFSKVANTETKWYEKDWTEIYALLIDEMQADS
jgi:predicted NACHT family NTPase